MTRFVLTLHVYTHRFTGTWYNTLSVIPLNSGAARIFWKMLHGPEVQPIFFNFAMLHPGDPKAATFHRMLKKKVDNLVSTQFVCMGLVLLHAPVTDL